MKGDRGTGDQTALLERMRVSYADSRRCIALAQHSVAEVQRTYAQSREQIAAAQQSMARLAAVRYALVADDAR